MPFYVVFTTAPRSSTLAKDIATHGTITVALVRQVNVSTPPSLPPTPPLTPPSSAEDPDSPSSPRQTHRRLLSRVARSAPTILLRTSRIPEEVTSSANKPLPRLPSAEAKPFFESRTILTDLYKGFPKRPRNHKPGHRSVSKDPNSSLPDGLYKGGIQLNKNMLPSFDWPGVSVKVHDLLHHPFSLRRTKFFTSSITWKYLSYFAETKWRRAYRYDCIRRTKLLTLSYIFIWVLSMYLWYRTVRSCILD